MSNSRCPVPQYNSCFDNVCYLYCPNDGSHMKIDDPVALQAIMGAPGKANSASAGSTSNIGARGNESSTGLAMCITSEGMVPCTGGS